MKKIISIFLMIAVLSSTAYALPCEDILKSFGINTSIPSQEYVTRSEFAFLISQLLMNDINNYDIEESAFIDVEKDSANFNSIIHLKKAGVITGANSLYFYPDKEISKEEAIIMAVRILGYEHKVIAGKSYYTVANQMDLLDGMSNSDKVTHEDAYILLYNILEADVSSTNPLDGERNPGEKRIMMSVRLGIEKIEGQVSDDGISSLYGKTETAYGNVVIDDVVLKNSSGRNDLLGKYVEGYYKEIDGIDVLLYAFDSGKSVTFNARDIKTGNDKLYEVYDENGRIKNYHLKKDFKVLYNGASISIGSGVTKAEFEKMLTPEFGMITLVSSGSNNYDIVIIRSYEIIVTKAVDNDKKIIYNYLDNPVSVCVDKYDYVNVYGVNGAHMEFSSITDKNVLYIYKSYNNEIIDIYISTNSISGTVTEFNAKNNTISIDGTAYEYEPLLLKLIDSTVLFNSSVNAYFGYDGKIVYITYSQNENAVWTYIKDIAPGKGLKDNVVLQVYTEFNEYREAELADAVKINGEKYKTQKDVYDTLCADPYALDNLSMVVFNSEGRITAVDTPYYPGSTLNNAPLSHESDNSIHVAEQIYQANKSVYSTRVGNGEIMLDETTRVFNVVKGGKAEDVYVTNVKDAIIAKEASTYTVTAYTIDDETMLADAIIIYKSAAGYDITNATIAQRVIESVVVTDIRSGTNEYGETSKILVVTSGGYEYRVSTVTENGAKDKDTGASVKVGDIIKYGTDKAGLIPDGQIAIMYSPESDKENLIHNTGSFNGTGTTLTHYSYGLFDGTVEMINDRYVKLLLSDSRKMIFPLAEFKYVVYDSSENKKVYLGDQTNIISSYGNNGAGVRMVVDWYSGKSRFAYIIK